MGKNTTRLPIVCRSVIVIRLTESRFVYNVHISVPGILEYHTVSLLPVLCSRLIKHVIIRQMHKYMIHIYIIKIIKYLKALQHAPDHKDPSWGRLVQYLAKITRLVLSCPWRGRSRCYAAYSARGAHVCTTGRILAKYFTSLPDYGSLWSGTCWSTFKYFIIFLIYTNHIFVHLLDNKF